MRTVLHTAARRWQVIAVVASVLTIALMALITIRDGFDVFALLVGLGAVVTVVFTVLDLRRSRAA